MFGNMSASWHPVCGWQLLSSIACSSPLSADKPPRQQDGCTWAPTRSPWGSVCMSLKSVPSPWPPIGKEEKMMMNFELRVSDWPAVKIRRKTGTKTEGKWSRHSERQGTAISSRALCRDVWACLELTSHCQHTMFHMEIYPSSLSILLR